MLRASPRSRLVLFGYFHFQHSISTMEVQTLSFGEKTTWIGSLVEAMVVETVLAAGKSLTCLLMLTGSLLAEINDSVSPNLTAMDGRFPLEALSGRKHTHLENKNASETEDDEDDDDDEDGDDDDEDGDDEDFSGEEGEDEGDPEDEPEANGAGGSDDDDDDDDDDDGEEEDDEDEDNEDEEDEEEETPQPPSKKRK
ncbi:hypothetical protein L6164_014287 [Bauhinia variegata]|uniref:Uncharacterized protein n=2 Tax=Bauhinia variegata TaxID=167791 RepID=A0ACB9NI09_BAUVA|nr:hypothetical protein L6164_014287 [Bauhinia variegata]